MKQILEILSAKNKSGIGEKSKKPYSMNICQCVVTDGVTGEIQVGELSVFEAAELCPVKGLYIAEFKIGVDFQTKKIGGELVSLTPYAKEVTVNTFDDKSNIASGKPAVNAPSPVKGAAL